MAGAGAILGLALAGAVGGLVFALLVARAPRERAAEIFAISLAYIAAIYVGPAVGGFAVADVAESLAAFGFLVFSIFSIRRRPLLLALGYVAHGLWDALHGSVLPAALPEWYAPACLGFDWAVAGVLLRLDRR
jgi:hypothetical protein